MKENKTLEHHIHNLNDVNKVNKILYEKNKEGWHCKQIIPKDFDTFFYLVVLEKDDNLETYFSNKIIYLNIYDLDALKETIYRKSSDGWSCRQIVQDKDSLCYLILFEKEIDNPTIYFSNYK